MASDLLAAFNCGRAFQHILSFHNDLRCCRTILLSDIQKGSLQPFFFLLGLVISEKIQLNVAILKVARDHTEPANVQARINLSVESIKQRGPDFFSAGGMCSKPDASNDMAGISLSIGNLGNESYKRYSILFLELKQ